VLSLKSTSAYYRMCITKVVCPYCDNIHSRFSKICPATPVQHSPHLTEQLDDIYREEPILFKSEKLVTFNPAATTSWQVEACAQVSEMCWKCFVEHEEKSREDQSLDAMIWKRQLQSFKHRIKVKKSPSASPKRKVSGVGSEF
jgi:hypothetical protein